MRTFCTALSLILILSASTLFASDGVTDYGRIATIDYLVERAISNNLIAGGVVVIGNHAGILSSTAHGRISGSPDARLLDQQTIFDLASLTKVIATTPAVMKLLDEGRISLSDPLTNWFPEFRGTRRKNTTILHLLTHTSGLTDFDMRTGQAMKTAIRTAAARKNRHSPGASFNYADINFILLGELVHRVSGKTLDVYSREELYGPLVASETMFLPPSKLADRIAPTLGIDSGTVQDRNARRLGGVAGHAGLFSSAQDLARFARMMLAGGTLDGRRILSEKAVEQMTSPFLCSNGTVVRGLGWDMNSRFSAPKGELFSEVSFGHSGYSGTSIWIDPKLDLFVVLLTNRLNYRDVRAFNQLRGDISTIAAAAFARSGTSQLLTAAPKATTITAVLNRKVQRNTPAGLRKIRLAAVTSDSKNKTHRQYGKKNSKNKRHKANVRARRV